MSKKISETASAGAMGSGAIAAVPGGGGGENTPDRLKNFMKDFFQKAQNRMRYKSVEELIPKTFKKLTESNMSLNSVFSELKNSETQSYDEKNVVTYGVEDDDGNLMKITVPHEQSEEFESTLTRQLAEIEDFKRTGHKGRNISMAELLYELKDSFTVLDVDFPTIPSNVVYNADQATEAVDDFSDESTDEFDDSAEQTDDMTDSNMDDNADNVDGEDDENMDDMDDESVEDFSDEPESNDAESILASVMSTLKAQADAEKAKADAEAEKARAKQAEYSAKAAAVEMERQEELVRIESEMEEQKEKEKEAKRISDIAKHNYSKSKSFTEGYSFSPLMESVLMKINEVDEFDTLQSLQRQKSIVRQKFAASPDDEPETKRFKQQQLKFAMDELNAKIRAARSREQYKALMQRKEDGEKEQADNQNNDRGAE